MRLRLASFVSLGSLLLFASSLYGQANPALFPSPKVAFLDANGKPLAGGFVYFYAAGTTTPQATYTDATLATQNANPAVLDSARQHFASKY